MTHHSENMPIATLVSSDHGFDDYDVEGIPTVHRVTVGHGIRNGDLFNVYCEESRKISGIWQGTLQKSLEHLAVRLACEVPDSILSEITDEVVYLVNATGDRTGYGTLEVTDEDLNRVPFERGPGIVLSYLTEIAGRKYVQGNLQVAFKDEFWGTDGDDYDSEDDVLAYCESVRSFISQRLKGAALLLPLDKGDPGRIIVQVAVSLESVLDSDDALRKLNDLFGTAADMADVADLADRSLVERKLPERDVSVIEVAMLDDEQAANFTKPYLCQHEDGRTVEFDTEDAACAYQREHRVTNGMDPMTGEEVEDRKLPESAELAVESLQVGDKVDLSSCPFLKDHASAEFEYAVVESVERETAECVAVSYVDHGVVGYPVGFTLKVSSETIASRNLQGERPAPSGGHCEDCKWSARSGDGKCDGCLALDEAAEARSAYTTADHADPVLAGKLPDSALQERGIELCILGAKTHGECENPDHEVGDLQDCVREMWRLMTPAQQQTFMASDSVRDRLEYNLPEEVFARVFPKESEPEGEPTRVRKTVIQYTVLHDDGLDLSSISLRDIAFECDEGGYVGGGLAVVTNHALTRQQVNAEAAKIGSDASFFDIDPEEGSLSIDPTSGI